MFLFNLTEEVYNIRTVEYWAQPQDHMCVQFKCRRLKCVKNLIEYLNSLKSCPHLILEISPYHISLIEHFALRLLAYLWFIGYLKVQWELKPSASRLLFSGISSQLGSGRQTVSLLLGLGLKLSFLSSI